VALYLVLTPRTHSFLLLVIRWLCPISNHPRQESDATALLSHDCNFSSLTSMLQNLLLCYSLWSLLFLFSLYISTNTERDFSYVIDVRSSHLRFIFQSERWNNVWKKTVWCGVIKMHITQPRDVFSSYSADQFTQLRTRLLMLKESNEVTWSANDSECVHKVPLCALDFITRWHYLNTSQDKPYEGPCSTYAQHWRLQS
jgi:hypothetical protein